MPDFLTVPFNVLLLIISTLLCWMTVLLLHAKRKKITIIPLYAFISALTLLLNILSLAGVKVVINQMYFYYSSTTFLTAIILSIILIYLFDGVLALKKLLEIILSSSIIAFLAIVTSSYIDYQNIFIAVTPQLYSTYFWSLLALIVDIIFVPVGWELLNKIKNLPTIISVFVILFLTSIIDMLVFSFGVYYGTDFLIPILQAGSVVRLILSISMGIVTTLYLKTKGFIENDRVKPDSLWDLVDIADLKNKSKYDLSLELNREQQLVSELSISKELYQNVVEIIDLGIWDWDLNTNNVIWSDKSYSLLGYTKDELPELNFEKFISMLHPDDIDSTNKEIKKSIDQKQTYRATFRLKHKNGDYVWFEGVGKTFYDNFGKAYRMRGYLADINDKKIIEKELQDKLEYLEKMNKLMVGRELKMIELKNKDITVENTSNEALKSE